MQHTTTRDECYYRSPTEPGVNSRGPLVSHVETLCGRTGAVRINIKNEQRRHSVRRYYLCEARLIWPRGTTTTPRAVRVFLADPGVRLAGGPCTECRQRRQPALRHLRCQLPCGYQHSRRPARRHHRRRPYGRSTALPLMAEHFGEDPKDLVVDAVDDRCGDGLTPLSGFISSIRPNVHNRFVDRMCASCGVNEPF